MAEAKLHNGRAIVAYVDGKAVDANGAIIEGAPPQPKDTPPNQQPGAAGGLTSEERIGVAIAQAITNPTGMAARAAAAGGPGAPGTPGIAVEDDRDFRDTSGESDSDEEEGLPNLADMPAHLASINDVDELKSMRRQDKRKGAKPLYAARIAELGG